MRKIKGIILAGGYGSRLYPLTLGASKQLLPVYDKPMIYYPLSVFMNANIRDILIISTPDDQSKFEKLFGDGNRLGLNIKYTVQKEPRGIAESFIIGSEFIGKDNVSLILGDNIFHGEDLKKYINSAISNLEKKFSTIFGVEVNNPAEFGVIECNQKGNITRINEKPKKPKSKLIVSGLYFYTNDIKDVVKKLKPSDRGELEITDVNNYYLLQKKLKLIKLNKKTSWSDTGTYYSLIKASKYFQEFEEKTNNKIACIEEVAYKMGFINRNKLLEAAESMKNSDYGKYLYKIAEIEN